MYKTQTTKKKTKNKNKNKQQKTKNKENLVVKFLILLYNQSRPFYSHSDSLPHNLKCVAKSCSSWLETQGWCRQKSGILETHWPVGKHQWSLSIFA